MPLPNDGEVRCMACGAALTLLDQNCWRCGSKKLEVVDVILALDETQEGPPSEPAGSVLSDVSRLIGSKRVT